MNKNWKTTRAGIAVFACLTFVLQTTVAFADTRYIETDQVVIGKKTSVNPSLTFRGLPNGIRVNSSTGLIEYSNDNTNFLQVGSGGGGGVGTELLPNADFELGGVTSGWTATGLTAANVTSGANLIDKKFSAALTATAVGQTFKSAALPILGLAGGQCAASLRYLYAGAAGDWVLTAYNGTATVGSLALPASTSANAPQTVIFPCGTAYTSTLQFILTSAVATPSPLYFDNAHLGAVQLYQGLVNGQPANVVRYLSGSGTYTPSTGATQIEVIMVGGGGGGGAMGSSALVGSTGTATTFGAFTAGPGTGGAPGNNSGGLAGGTGGAASGGNVLNIVGQSGQASSYPTSASQAGGMTGGAGGSTMIGGGGQSVGTSNSAGGQSAAANTGAGGQGSPQKDSNYYAGAGGGAGGLIDTIIANPAASYSYTVGTGGAGGVGSGYNGGAGGSGIIIIRETFQTVTQQAFLPSSGGLAAGDTVSGAWAQCPTGTIAADGSAVSRAQYPALFAAAGTQFGAGDGSTTFNLPLVPSVGGSTPLVSYGVNQISGTTTNPTKGTTTNDLVRAEQASGDHWHIKGEYKQTTSGSSAGSGDYLILLPNGLQFDPAKTTFYTGGVGSSPVSPSSPIGLGHADLSFNGGSPTYAGGTVVPYDATHFRLAVSYVTTSGTVAAATGFFGSAFYPLNIAPSLTMSYDFEAPILSYATSYLKTCVRTTAASAAPIQFGGVSSVDNSAGTTVINTSQTYTANATLSSNIETAFGNTTTAAFTLTLPDPTLNKSKKFIISKTNAGANLLGVTGNIAGTAGKTTYLIGQSEQIQLQSDGTTWQWLSDSRRTVSATIAGASNSTNCTTSPCTVYQPSSPFIASNTYAATGSYNVTFVTGIFASNVACTASGFSSTPQRIYASLNSVSTTGFGNSMSIGSADKDGYFYFICVGDR